MNGSLFKAFSFDCGAESFTRLLDLDKDTIFVSSPVLWGAGHVEQDQMSPLGFVDDHLVELHRCMHAADIRLVPGGVRWLDGGETADVKTELRK